VSFLEKNLSNSISLIDERLSSIEAEKTMHKMNIKTGHNKDKIDKIAASVILQEYLDSYVD
jgi:Predicted endonuclease involved in recombination (possible Holliday junction resolvase in Mycoplasmas and B. subtilis)